MINKLNLVAKRTISVFLSLMIVISTVSVCITNFIAFATTQTHSVVRKVNSDSLTVSPVTNAQSAVNRVLYRGKKPDAPKEEFFEDFSGALEKLTNGSNTEQVDFFGCPFASNNNGVITEYKDGSTVYFDIIYILNSKTDISDIVVIGNSGNWKLSYELYASNTMASLFDGDPIYTHKDKASGQHYEVAGITAKYVAMRVISVSTKENGSANNSASNYITRLRQFNVYGTPSDEADEAEIVRVVNSNKINASPVTDATSAVRRVLYKGKKLDASKEEGFEDFSGALQKLTNGSNTEQVDFFGCPFASNNNGVITEYKDGTKVYFDIVYMLNSKTDISDIVVVGNLRDHTNGYVSDWKLSYELYASDTMATLFDEDPIYTHTEKAIAQHYKLTGISAKYVAMRVISVSTNENGSANNSASNYITRLRQFNVYGTPSDKADESEIVRVTNSNKLTVSPIDDAKSVVNSVRYNCKKIHADGPESLIMSSGILEKLTKGSNTEQVDLFGCSFASSDDEVITEYKDGKKVYFDIIYTLNSKTDISDIVVIGNLREHEGKYISDWKLSYKLYASDTMADLFDGEPIYTHTDKAIAQHYELTGITAKYVAMRVISVSTNENGSANNSASNYITRLRQFNVYGTPSQQADEKEFACVINDDNKNTSPVTDAESVVKSMEQYNKAYSETYTTASSKPYFRQNNGKEISDPAKVLKKLTDGNGEVTVEFPGEIFAGKDADGKVILNSLGTVYYDIVYELDGKCDISDIVVIGNKDKWKLSYELYLADNKYDLFNSSNRVYEHKTKKQLQHYSAFGMTAKYVGMRVTHVTTENNATAHDSSWAYYPRILEFNVYGTKIAEGESGPYLAETKEPLTYLSVVNKANAYYYNGKKAVKYEEGDIATLTDGSVDESDGMFLGDADITPFAKANGSKIKFYGNRELRIEYTLKGAASVSDIFIHSNLEKDYITQEYKLYASMKYEDLYNSPIYEFSNPGKNAVQLYDVNFKANYVALVITKPCTEKASIDSAYPSLLEFDVYGVVGDDYEPNAPRYPDTSKMDLSKVKSKYGKNLLKFENLSYVERNVKSTSTGKKEQDKIIENFFKSTNNGKEHIDVPELSVADDKVTAFVFNLSDYDFTKVKGFAFQGLASNNTAHYTSHFKVFVAEEKEDLFLESNLVFEYKVDDETPIQRGVFYEIPKDECPVGRYIAFQIVKPYYTATRDIYPRISYLWAWGEEAIIPVNPTNLAENMPLDAYFAVGEDKDMVKESNLTAKEVANLTDGDTKTLAKINTKGNDCNTLELLYNLCNYAKIDEIAVDALINKTTGFKTLKIYAADAIAAVYEDDAHVWTYNVSGNGNVVATKKFKESITARYFRLVFEGTKDEVVLNEISIIGGDNQKFKTRNLNSTLTADNVSVTRTDLETGKTQAVAMNATVAGGLIDSSTASCIRLLKGVVGKDKYDITVHLGDLRAVSRIQLNFFDKIHSIYNPKSVNVYIGETYEEIFDEEAEPLFTISEDEINKGEYVKYIRPMLARYIRLELKEFNEVEYLVNEDGTYPITAVISDLIPFGTKVNGLQEDEFNEVMLEFADEDTNSKLAICKLDNSDIYTDVVNINVTENKATNWQMKSLENANLAIVDKTVYTFELVDLYGNKVTDINNRKIIISFEAPKSTDISKLVIGDAYKRTTVAPINTTISDDGKMVCAEFEWKTDSDNKFVLLEMITADDAYWENIGELEDFSEGTDEDLMNEHDIFWYDSIHTTDEIFTVTPVSLVFPEGLEFVATDISGEVSEEKCKSVISVAGGKQIAIYYDMKLYLNNEEYDLYGEIVDITLNPPASVTNNFTDLEVYHVDDYGVITPLWSETTADGSLLFQTNSFSDFVIVGNSINGGEQQGDSSNGMPYDDEEISDVVLDDFGTDSEFDDSQNNSESQDQYENQEGASPQTGESSEKLFAIFAFMIAAAYVTFISAKKKEDE